MAADTQSLGNPMPNTRARWLVIGLLLCPALVAGADGAADWRSTVRQLAERQFRNPAWGYSHSVRDYRVARELAARDHVVLDDDVLYAAAFLHDMAAFAPYEKADVDHADEAARIVGETLRGTGFPMDKLERVRGAIRTHMFDRDPQGPEALYLHDADALDWLGAIGAARILGLVDPNGGKPDGPAAVQMIEENLRLVPARVLSPAGRSQVDARVTELRDFLDRLRRETDSLRDL
ncbi:MAG: HD domain-containing protein [Proteobacteria bacterium]|nr:HD domain-containing protein [Pseudomonadota bacterium]